MTTQLQDREAAPETPLPDGEHVVVPPYACEACGAGMVAGQDWCLDCGTAAPGRLGARPGWRAAFTVVGLTLLLLVAAVAASYAALTGDAAREAARPSKGSGTPITAQTPGLAQPGTPVTPGETGPGTTAPKPKIVRPPAVAPPPAIKPPTTVTPNVLAPKANAGSNNTAKGDSTSSGSNESNASANPAAISLAADAATLYDPGRRAGAEFGPPKNAIDAKDSTVWDVTVPADGKPLGVGIVIDLGAEYALESLRMVTPTSGFDFELYGTKGTTIPPDLLDSRWDHISGRANYTDGKLIPLTGKAKGKVRFVGLWFTAAADKTDPRVAIGDVQIAGTK